jgi:hypothetical protein
MNANGDRQNDRNQNQELTHRMAGSATLAAEFKDRRKPLLTRAQKASNTASTIEQRTFS